MATTPQFNGVNVTIDSRGGIARTSDVPAVLLTMRDGSRVLMTFGTVVRRSWDIAMTLVLAWTEPSGLLSHTFRDETNTTYTVAIDPGSFTRTASWEKPDGTTYYDYQLRVVEL